MNLTRPRLSPISVADINRDFEALKISSYTQKANKIRDDHLTIPIGKQSVELQKVGEGSFSKVYTVSGEPLLQAEIPNEQIVVKILHERHCGAPDLSSSYLGTHEDKAIVMIEKAISQNNKLKKIFKNKQSQEYPIAVFYNPNQVLECGYSVCQLPPPKGGGL